MQEAKFWRGLATGRINKASYCGGVGRDLPTKVRCSRLTATRLLIWGFLVYSKALLDLPELQSRPPNIPFSGTVTAGKVKVGVAAQSTLQEVTCVPYKRRSCIMMFVWSEISALNSRLVSSLCELICLIPNVQTL